MLDGFVVRMRELYIRVSRIFRVPRDRSATILGDALC